MLRAVSQHRSWRAHSRSCRRAEVGPDRDAFL